MTEEEYKITTKIDGIEISVCKVYNRMNGSIDTRLDIKSRCRIHTYDVNVYLSPEEAVSLATWLQYPNTFII